MIGPARYLRPRYNIAPTTQTDVLRLGDARAETVAEKPMFRSAFKTCRCIILACGFYEWTGERGA